MEDFTDGFVMGQSANNDGFGNGGWWIIILFALIFGWGNNGNYGRGGGGGAADNYVLASDFATIQRQLSDGTNTIERKLDSQNAGICDLGYTTAQLINGVGTALSTQGYETRNAITQAQIAQMQSANALQGQLAECCCANREAIAGVNYNNNTNTRDIIDNANANFRALNDKITALELSAKQEKIAEQNQRITALELAASQTAQNAYLINQLRPSPIPAYSVANPYCCNTTGCC